MKFNNDFDPDEYNKDIKNHQENLLKVIDGNIGALKCVEEIIKNNCINVLKYICENKLKGSQIAILWNDCCNRDVDFMDDICFIALNNFKANLYLQCAIKQERTKIEIQDLDKLDFSVFAKDIFCEQCLTNEMAKHLNFNDCINYCKPYISSRLSELMIPFVDYNFKFDIEVDERTNSYRVIGIATPKKDK